MDTCQDIELPLSVRIVRFSREKIEKNNYLKVAFTANEMRPSSFKKNKESNTMKIEWHMDAKFLKIISNFIAL